MSEAPGREDRSPARPDEIVAYVSAATRAHLEAAARAAREALPAWAATPAPERGEILFRAAALLAERAETIGRDMVREQGKTLPEAIGETRRAAAILRYFAGQASEPIGEVYASATRGTRLYTQRSPIGVVAVITPWNFPIAIPAWKIAPALAFGNTVLFKPASHTPLTGNHLVTALVDAGLPPGVLGMVFADGPLVEEAWVASGVVDGVTFTGSATVGRALARVASDVHARVQLELGGKNAVIVAPDADLARAADLIVRGAMASAGQKCTATARVIGYGGSLTALRELLVERVRSLRIGDPLDPATTLGPLIDDAARTRVAAMVADAEADGANVIARPDVPPVGAYHPPIVLDGVTPTMPVAQDEVFGPVVGLIEAADLDEALRIHNGVAYGLSGSIFTRDLATAEAFIATARVGLVHVNGETAGAEPHVPFGGMGASSSWSREQGKSAVDFYTQVRTVYVEGLPALGAFDR
ncbi:MAG: aldehyde dehydrogenase family protein [Chloroflexi bacterium]|nr:aldehyde dehydrogenase family protein [Chloroflexota bacterium]